MRRAETFLAMKYHPESLYGASLPHRSNESHPLAKASEIDDLYRSPKYTLSRWQNSSRSFQAV